MDLIDLLFKSKFKLPAHENNPELINKISGKNL